MWSVDERSICRRYLFGSATSSETRAFRNSAHFYIPLIDATRGWKNFKADNICEIYTMTAQASTPKIKELRLPISRVKTIMKSSPYVDTVGQDGLYLVTKATELFIHYLTEEAHMQSNKGSSLDYKHLAEEVQTNNTLEFLREIMPRKITVRQFKEMMAAKNASQSSSSESSSDSDSDSDSDTDSCSDSDETKAENGNSSDSEQESETKENGNAASDKSECSVKSDSEEENKR